jgi:hypothetical protein
VRIGVQAPREVRVLRGELPRHSPPAPPAEMTAPELNADAPPMARTTGVSQPPLASRLLARRGPCAMVGWALPTSV